MRLRDLNPHQQKLLQRLPDAPADAVLCRGHALRTARLLELRGLATVVVDATYGTFVHRTPAGKLLCKPALELGKRYTATITTARIVRDGRLRIDAALDTGETFTWYVSPHGDR